MSGIRTVKIANGLKHVYVTQNGKVVRESVYGIDTNTGEYTVFQYVLDFTYDEVGHPLTMRRYNNSNMQTDYITMQYVCNAQGDVVKLVYGNGTVYAEYTYDAWGNILSSSGSMANANPLRYRGYFYDTESGFYYLQSRYYDPALGRFINADSFASTGQGFLGYDMFAYCGNNPVILSDHSGYLYIEQHPFISTPNETGFSIQVSEDFLDPAICLYYSYELIDQVGNGRELCGMGAERIALEIHAHAVFYYWGKERESVAPSVVDLSSFFATYFVNHGDPIDVNNDETNFRLFVYHTIWGAHISGLKKAYVRTLYQAQKAQPNPHPKGGPNKEVPY